MLADTQQRVQAHPKKWLKALNQNPDGFAKLQQRIDRAVVQMADCVAAGMLAQAAADSAFGDAAKKTTSTDPKRKLRDGEPCSLRVRPLGGLLS